MTIIENNVNHYYLSASEYADKTGIGEAEVKKQLKTGFLEGFITDGGHYKIKVYKNDSVSLKQYEKVLQENTELKTKMLTIRNLV